MVDAVYPSLVFLAGAVGITAGAFSWRYRDQPGAVSHAAFATAAGCWTIAEGLSIVRGGLETSEFWTGVGLSLSVVVPLAWLTLVVSYTGKWGSFGRRALAALLVEPVVFLGLVWTNDRHGLVWTGGDRTAVGEFDAFVADFGVAFWGHQAYSYLLLAAGVALLVVTVMRSTRPLRWQTTALLFAITVPAVVNALSIFELLPPEIAVAGLSYVVAGVLLALALLDTQLRSVAPVTREVGREAVLSELDDAIIILDGDDRLVDANPAGERLLGTEKGTYLGRPLGAVYPELASTLPDDDERTAFTLEDPTGVSHYDVRVSSLHGGYGAISGRVVSLRDVTAHHQREQRVDVLNRLLRHNIRNELNVVRGQVELARPAVTGEHGDERLAKAIETIDEIVALSDKVGRISRLLDSESTGTIDVASAIETEVNTGELSNLDADITIDLPGELHVSGGLSLVAAFEELVRNAVEHTDSAEPRVRIRVDEAKSDDRHVVVTVADNGPGIDDQEWQAITAGEETPLRHGSGVGLWLVTWVVGQAGGTISFENDDKGAIVAVQLPRAATDGVEAAHDDRVRPRE